MNNDIALDTLSALISELKSSLNKAESTYKQLDYAQKQIFIQNTMLMKLRQDSVHRIAPKPKYTIIYTYNRKLVISCLCFAIIFSVYINMSTSPPAMWTVWGLIAISDLVAMQMV